MLTKEEVEFMYKSAEKSQERGIEQISGYVLDLSNNRGTYFVSPNKQEFLRFMFKISKEDI